MRPGDIAFVAFIVVLVLVWSVLIWRNNHKPLPLFCTECGCPMVKTWRFEDTSFDPRTGVGTKTERARWTCSTAVDMRPGARSWHSDIALNGSRTSSVTSRCDTA